MTTSPRMARILFRTIGAILKGLAYIAVGFLLGILPLLVVIAYKCLKGGIIAAWRVTTWIRSA